MKENLLFLALFTFASLPLHAGDSMLVEGGVRVYGAYPTSEYATGLSLAASGNAAGKTENEKDMKIATLNKLLDQQQRLYEEKVTYLEDELKKSKERLIEKSINHDKMQAGMERRFNEETGFLKKEIVAKTKTLMEYQRQLEKIKPSEDMKNLIRINTELAVELRKSVDQIAIIQLKGDALASKPDPAPGANGRMPASTGK